MRSKHRSILLLGASLLLTLQAKAQESTVYAPVLSTRLFVVGAANPQTGLRYQHPSDDTTWMSSGPDNIRAFDIAADPASRGKILYMASGNGLHKTTDGGKRWKIVTGWDITEILCVALDPHNSQTVYLASAYGINKSTDGGNTWSLKNNGLGSTYTPNVVVDYQTPGRLYCSADDGVYTSSDGGDSWHKLGLNVGHIRVIEQSPHNPAVLIAGTEDNGIYMTRNGGEWWTKSESGVDQTTFYAFAFDPRHDNVIYAGGYLTGIYKSTDGGSSWHRGINEITPVTIHAIAVDPTNNDRVYAGSYEMGIYRSDDAGKHWRTAGLSTALIWKMEIQPY